MFVSDIVFVRHVWNEIQNLDYDFHVGLAKHLRYGSIEICSFENSFLMNTFFGGLDRRQKFTQFAGGYYNKDATE